MRSSLFQGAMYMVYHALEMVKHIDVDKPRDGHERGINLD